MKNFINFGNWVFHYRNYIFPVFYLALFIPSPEILSSEISLIAGITIITIGIFVRCLTIGLEYIVRGGQNRKIYADKLVTGGIYTLCRNPMYLGNILLILGFGIFANSMLFVFLFFPLFLVIYLAIIKAEEGYLENKFGDEYKNFRQNVNMLLPDLRKVNKAFKGHRFNVKRIIVKEYNSLYIYFSAIGLILLYKGILSLQIFVILWIVISLIYFIIKLLKRKSVIVAN